jgi:hypothetical protein
MYTVQVSADGNAWMTATGCEDGFASFLASLRFQFVSFGEWSWRNCGELLPLTPTSCEAQRESRGAAAAHRSHSPSQGSS